MVLGSFLFLFLCEESEYIKNLVFHSATVTERHRCSITC